MTTGKDTTQDATDDTQVARKRRGRPTVMTPKIVEEILIRVATGQYLTNICDDPSMPDRRTVARHAIRSPEFCLMLSRAKEMRARFVAEELEDVAEFDVQDIPDPRYANAEVQRRRLKSENRRWLIERDSPGEYGQKAKTENTPSRMTHEDLVRILDEQRRQRALTPVNPRPLVPGILPLRISYNTAERSETDK